MTSFANHPHMPALRSFQRSVSLSPPDTDNDPTLVPPGSLPRIPGEDFDVTGHYLGATPERARYQPRRTFAMPYQNSGTRDVRERGHTRGSRNLVVVVPPADFPLDQGQLGNVLSMGPRHRLSQGILMPLFPSMFGQLNAIAREYNFPSTVGLCLYLHINENGITMTPRISEDSWQYLFGHLFGDHTPGGQQLPIGGSIEFDIDLNKARWFDAWLSGALRDSESFPQLVTSPPSSGAPWRGHSKTTDADEQHDRWDVSGSATLINNSRPETALRHLPRKLSLVDRLDVRSLHVSPESQKHPDSPSPTHDLSPIPQSAVPRSLNSDLENRVKSWMATTELFPASMTEAYKEIPDPGTPVHVTTMDEYALERNFGQGVKVEEYVSSVTPPGPVTLVMESPIPSSQLSSVYDGRRAHETILLAPAEATSWGPTEDVKRSVISSASVLPSPNMRERVLKDRAIWGNSFGWHTATTWKEVYPYSVVKSQPTIRVQLQDSNGPLPQYPNLVIYPSVYPPKSSHQSVWGSSFGWKREVTWRRVYPYSTVMVSSVALIQLSGAGGLVSKYPGICIYPAAYPSYEIYPVCSIEEDASAPAPVVLTGSGHYYPSLVIYPAVYPHFNIYPPIAEGTETKGLSHNTSIYGASISYPNLVVYPAVYPHFDLYPATLQVAVTPKLKEVVVRLQNVGHPAVKYPSISIYPSAYPHLDIYPIQHPRKAAASAIWSISFGWLSAKTWNQVYPLHVVKSSSTTGRRIDDPNLVIVNTAARKQAVWGSSFGWKNATTWRAVWPTSYAEVRLNTQVTVHLGRQRDSLNYPYLVIYPIAYPYFYIYPDVAAVAKTEKTQTSKSQCAVSLIPYYPSLVIYPAVYPHLDVYPAFAITAEPVEGQSNLRRRRIEIWRAKTAAQVGLAELLANNHNWEVDEPLRLDLADYAWSQTSAGPPTSPLDLSYTPSIPRSVHMDRRVQGSMALTPSTATTWDPQDDDCYSDVLVKALPSVFIREYPRLVICESSCVSSFDLYPSWKNTSASENQVTENTANPNIYPVINMYPAVYPYFDIYPNFVLQIESPDKADSNVQHARIQTRLPYLYPNLNIYRACYPYNLDHVYPSICTKESIRTPLVASRGYPWLVVYSPVYPFVIPYPERLAEIIQLSKPDQSDTTSLTEWKSINVKLSTQYPSLDPYPAVQLSVHPLSDSVPGPLDEGEYEYAEVKTKNVNSGFAAYVGDLATPMNTTLRKSHKELHDLVFHCLEKQPARNSKTHLQLHTEVFRDGIVWTPSGYAQDIASLTPKTWEHILQEPPGHPRQSNSTPHPSRLPSGTPGQSPYNTVFPTRQPSAQLPLHIRTPGIPPLAVSETPIPRVSSPPTPRTTGSRFSQAIRSIVHRRTVSTTCASPPPEDHKELPKDHRRFLSMVDNQQPIVLPPLSDAEPMRRVPRLSQTEGFVYRRVRIYEQATAGNEGTLAQSSFTLPPLPPMAPMTDVTETIDQSRYTYA